MAGTLERIKGLVASELDIPMERLDSTRPLEELGVDSLSTIEVMFKIEDVFGIHFPEERAPIRTLQDIADLLDRLLAEGSAAGRSASPA